MTPTQVFSCEHCEIFKNTYFEEHLRTVEILKSSQEKVKYQIFLWKHFPYTECGQTMQGKELKRIAIDIAIIPLADMFEMINSFCPNVSILYLLETPENQRETPENQRRSWCSQMGIKWEC